MKKLFYFAFFVFVVSGVYLLVSYNLKIAKYDFTAQSTDGEVSMKSFDGMYKIVYFGYVFCPDVCPTTLTLVSSVLDDIKAKDVKILFATLDLQRDDIKTCDEFAKYFYRDSSCIRLENGELDKVVNKYGAKYKIVDLNDSVMKYSVAHSSSIFLFDKKGRFVSEVTNLTYDNVKKEIQNLLINY